MSKTVKLACPGTSTSSSSNFDWRECVFCQVSTLEELQCPANTKRTDLEVGAGYKSLEAQIRRCESLQWFPVPIPLDLLNDGNGFAVTMHNNQAKWHKSCRNKFSDLKLSRYETRKRKESEVETSAARNKVTRKSVGSSTMTMTKSCFFCGQTSGELHEASTFNIDTKVRKCALDLQDTVLLAKLSVGDMISQEAKYHRKCLISLYNKARTSTSSHDGSNSQIHGIVLAELVAYIEESRTETDVIPIFKLVDLTKMYTSRLEQFCVEPSSRIHSTDLKNRLLAAVPDLQAHKQGRDVILIFNDDIGNALRQSTCINYDNDALVLSKAAQIVRQEMFSTKYNFNGTFQKDCQHDSVPQSLKSLIAMILGGPNIQTQSGNFIETQSILTIAQLLQFNCTNRRRKDSTYSSFHTRDREPPLPVYLGLLIHAETRKRGLVEKLNSLGMSISYDRVMQLSTALGNSICDQYVADNVVCPAKLRYGIFTTAAVDNIDHNPSSSTAQGSLHGTAISLFQHPSKEYEGLERPITPISTLTSNNEHLKPLPESYSVVPPAVLPQERSEMPPVHGPLMSDCSHMTNALSLETRWLNHVSDVLQAENIDDVIVSWSAFHANQIETTESKPLDISSLLPLFYEEAKSTAMIRHAMNIAKQCVTFLNPGQVPVLACDQPLYALAKSIQWNWPENFSESHVVVLFGGLHIELAALRTIGDWLDNSGWTSALAQANVASAGTADSFLKASHVSRTIHAHQVTACALNILMRRSYDNDQDLQGTNISFEEWRQQRESENPLFHFWSVTLRFQLTILIFVRSLREANFALYKDSLTALIPWFFALDHPNYARWLPVHIRDMMNLQNTAPSVETEFIKGNFVIRKTHSKFSCIAIDHAHEQNNKLVKGEGGAIGLTENMSQLLRWMVSGPEMARVINEFELSQEVIKFNQSKGPDFRHHEQVKSVQTTFSKQVKALCATLEEMGNPFLETSEDLLILGTRDIVDPCVAETIRQVERLGQEQYKSFVTERLEDRSKSLYIPIKQNRLQLFSRQQPKVQSKEKLQITSLKQNCSLFSQLYVSCQVRSGDIDEFFKHENQPYPPSLSQFGELRFGSKSDLLTPLEKIAAPTEEYPLVDVMILDGAAIINMLRPRGVRTFQDYFQEIFLPYILKQLLCVQRIDVVFDEYIQNSLKARTRCIRGKGTRRRVQADSIVPSNWEGFLRVDENKQELFAYLADQLSVVNVEQQKQIITTKGSNVLSVQPRDQQFLSPCTHEEADTRMMIHAFDAVQEGLKRVMFRTVDTDVVVIAISCVQDLGADEVWIAFGTGKSFRYLAVHEIANFLGPSKSRALLFFHAFSGCDQVSSFANKGKKTAWETWSNFGEVTPTFERLSTHPEVQSVLASMDQIQRYVILMYDKTSECMNVDEARRYLFTRKGRPIENIPPTESALIEHTKRAVYQAGYCWGQCLNLSPQNLKPEHWGWTQSHDQIWVPHWTSLQQASISCSELIKCGCKVENGCRGRCKCKRADMLCTALCKCGGGCDRD